MAVGRKGVVFTLMAIILVVFLISSQRIAEVQRSPLKAETAAAVSRVSLMNAYSETFRQHAEQSLATSGYFTLQNLSNRVRLQGEFFDPDALNATVASCVVNGTVNVSGAAQPCLPDSLRLNDSLALLASLSRDELGIETAYAVLGVGVTEEDPLSVVFWANVTYNISDEFAKWTYNDLVRADVPLDGVPDPLHEFLYAAGTTSERRNFSLAPFLNAMFWPNLFDSFYANRTYIVLPGKSPSALQRYTGQYDQSSVCCGVESVLVRSSLATPSPASAYQNFSMTDHQFLSHLQGRLSKYDCTDSEVKAYEDIDGETLVLDAQRFDTTYNLSPALTPCSS